jgi:proline iminopeptidase
LPTARRIPRCLGFILRGISLYRKSEIEWFLYGLNNLFPEAWHAFNAIIPRRAAKICWTPTTAVSPPWIPLSPIRSAGLWHGSCSTLLPSAKTTSYFASNRVALGLARLEAHYFKHDTFLPENPLLNSIGRLRGIPAVIVQGHYDAVCPNVSTDDLQPRVAGNRIPDRA